MIEEYRFGKMMIEGDEYNYDVEVDWEGEVLEWTRKNSHIIDKEDIERALEKEPEIIVVGTGESGVAQVTEDAKQKCKEAGVELIIDITEEAVKTFNVICAESLEEDGEQAEVIGLFHLTC
ncbi:hypothetical protein KJ591_02565 [Patescibacteria group bacterium]|nr:hypothetical protein [Patescibacteria group bacterium]MBU4023221.1 hypothetical protein [Patescibacteria group bacterium]MBU4162183.1 hypothetical protein [Patescibacteria group bacterium]